MPSSVARDSPPGSRRPAPRTGSAAARRLGGLIVAGILDDARHLVPSDSVSAPLACHPSDRRPQALSDFSGIPAPRCYLGVDPRPAEVADRSLAQIIGGIVVRRDVALGSVPELPAPLAYEILLQVASLSNPGSRGNPLPSWFCARHDSAHARSPRADRDVASRAPCSYSRSCSGVIGLRAASATLDTMMGLLMSGLLLAFRVCSIYGLNFSMSNSGFAGSKAWARPLFSNGIFRSSPADRPQGPWPFPESRIGSPSTRWASDGEEKGFDALLVTECRTSRYLSASTPSYNNFACLVLPLTGEPTLSGRVRIPPRAPDPADHDVRALASMNPEATAGVLGHPWGSTSSSESASAREPLCPSQRRCL